ncbi:MAG: 1,4-alpha-glucan branching protein GlgB [Ruminococcus sp.]|nr:1,4-alpha-glucan branching protein GlgB [Ruminococcus sp.]
MNCNFDEIGTELELFNSGANYSAYNTFGAHLADSDGKKGVVFRVWAPNALSVSVVGSFNEWNCTSHFMNKLSGGSWELFIEGIEPFTSYKYCIETPDREKILKSDPFAFHAEKRPNNASVVFDIEKYIWNDDKWFETRKNCDKLKTPMNIYEMHLGSWKRDSDNKVLNYRKIADELVPYLSEMHYTHVQFMPVMEHPLDESWGFQTTGYFAATSRYGTPTDLMYLIDCLHNAGIGVIIDWTPSNFPKDDFGLSKFDGTAIYENEDPRLGERRSWGTCLFNFARHEVLSFLISSALFWLEKYHIDGLRVGALSSMMYLDYSKSKDEWIPNAFGGKENLEAIDFIQRLNNAVHEKFPDVIMFAEENTGWPKLTRPTNESGLGFDFKWNVGWINDALHYMTLDPQWRPFNHDNLTFSFFYAFAENFILPLSHDELSHGLGPLISKMPGEYDDKFAGVRAFITYMFAHPGKKFLFMGSEIGQFDEWDVKSSLQWNLLDFEKHSQLNLFFRDINKFYIENKPLYELDTIWKGFDWIHHDDFTNSVIAFKRTDSEGNDIIAVCNFQPNKHKEYNIGVPKYGLYDEIFSSDRLEYGGTGTTNGTNLIPQKMKIHGCEQGLSLTIPPLSVIYLKCVKVLDVPT